MKHPMLFLSATMTASKSTCVLSQTSCGKRILFPFPTTEARKIQVGHQKKLSKDQASEVMKYMAYGSCRISTRNNLAHLSETVYANFCQVDGYGLSCFGGA